LNGRKSVKSITLPNNRNVIILAATLSNKDLGTQANLSPVFNVAGIYNDGMTFSQDGGLDGGGAAYSANLLNDETGAASIVVNGTQFNLGLPNTTDAVYGTGKPIPLPSDRFTKLHILATGVQGNQTAQQIVVTYADGTTSTLTQSFSDWFTSQSFSGEDLAVKMPYRDNTDGSKDQQTFSLYAYTLNLNPTKAVRSLILPANRDVVILAITLTKASLF
jgi:hypothetical protein